MNVLIEYDPEVDALFASFRTIAPGDDIGAQVLDDSRMVHYAGNDEVIGVEFLDATQGINLADVPHAEEIAAALKAFRNIQPAA